MGEAQTITPVRFSVETEHIQKNAASHSVRRKGCCVFEMGFTAKCTGIP